MQIMSEFVEPMKLVEDVDKLYAEIDTEAENLRILSRQHEAEAESKSLPADDRPKAYRRMRRVETVRLLELWEEPVPDAESDNGN